MCRRFVLLGTRASVVYFRCPDRDVDKLVNTFSKMYQADMQIICSRPIGSPLVLQVRTA